MQRNLSLDILRIIACFGVIVIHITGGAFSNQFAEKGTLWYNEYIVLDALFRWSVPVFAMITGYFLLDPKKDLPIKKLFRKYLFRIVIALIFWSVIYSVSLHQSIYPFGSQGAHFWYLGMLIGLYLSLPILRIIAQNPLILKYYCIAWVIYMIYTFLGRFIVLPFQLQDVIFLRYAGYCLAAYYIKVYLSNKNNKLVLFLYIIGTIGLLITVLTTIINQNPNSNWWLYDAPNVLVTALAVFLFFVRHPISLNPRFSRFIETCSKCTFGIYLMHMWVLIQILTRVYRFISDPFLLTVICGGFTFCSTFLLTWVIKKVPYIKDIIV